MANLTTGFETEYDAEDIKELSNWLASVSLSNYTKPLYDLGGDLQTLQAMSDDDITSTAISVTTNTNDQMRFIQSVKQLKQQGTNGNSNIHNNSNNDIAAMATPISASGTGGTGMTQVGMGVSNHIQGNGVSNGHFATTGNMNGHNESCNNGNINFNDNDTKETDPFSLQAKMDAQVAQADQLLQSPAFMNSSEINHMKLDDLYDTDDTSSNNINNNNNNNIYGNGHISGNLMNNNQMSHAGSTQSGSINQHNNNNNNLNQNGSGGQDNLLSNLMNNIGMGNISSATMSTQSRFAASNNNGLSFVTTTSTTAQGLGLFGNNQNNSNIGSQSDNAITNGNPNSNAGVITNPYNNHNNIGGENGAVNNMMGGNIESIYSNNNNNNNNNNNMNNYNINTTGGITGAVGGQSESKIENENDGFENRLSTVMSNQYRGDGVWYCMIDCLPYVSMFGSGNSNGTPFPQDEQMYWSPYPDNIQKQLFEKWSQYCKNPTIASNGTIHIQLQNRHYRVFFIKDQIGSETPCAFQMSDGGVTRQIRLDKPDAQGCVWGFRVLPR